MSPWFSAVAVFEIYVKEELQDDRSISMMVVSAPNEQAAYAAARRHAGDAEETYLNSDGEIVAWRAAEILTVYPLVEEALEEGTEVYSCLVTGELLDAIRSRLVG